MVVQSCEYTKNQLNRWIVWYMIISQTVKKKTAIFFFLSEIK